MSTNYPTSLDSLTNPSPSDSMATVSHSGQHTNANDAIEALQAKVGVDSSAVTTSLDYRVAQLELGGGGGGGASVTVSDTAPSSPSEGDLWFESDTGDILVYYGSAWVDVGGTSVANIAVQSTAPSSPVNGDFWFDTDTAQTFVWYDDGTSTQWVEVGAASAAASGTDGAVQFASGGAFSSDATNLVWDDTNNRLGIGTSTPTVDLEVSGTVKAGDFVGNVTATSVSTTNLTVDTDTLYVDSTNNRVGIGTTSPNSSLHIDSGSVTNPTHIFTQGYVANNAADTRTGTVRNAFDSNTDYGTYWTSFRGANGGSYKSLFGVRTGGTDNDVLTVDSSGNVGINDTTPSYKLDVNGDINATGDLRINGTAVGSYTPYTPSSTGGLTLGNGVIQTSYTKINKFVHTFGYIVLGTTSSVSPYVDIALPVTNSTGTFESPTGNALFWDRNGYVWKGATLSVGNTTVRLLAEAVDGTRIRYADLTSTVPFTWTNLDVLYWNIMYRAA